MIRSTRYLEILQITWFHVANLWREMKLIPRGFTYFGGMLTPPSLILCSKETVGGQREKLEISSCPSHMNVSDQFVLQG